MVRVAFHCCQPSLRYGAFLFTERHTSRASRLAHDSRPRSAPFPLFSSAHQRRFSSAMYLLEAKKKAEKEEKERQRKAVRDNAAKVQKEVSAVMW